eukprot:4059198-Prymnesium_polylepis.1
MLIPPRESKSAKKPVAKPAAATKYYSARPVSAWAVSAWGVIFYLETGRSIGRVSRFTPPSPPRRLELRSIKRRG